MVAAILSLCLASNESLIYVDQKLGSGGVVYEIVIRGETVRAFPVLNLPDVTYLSVAATDNRKQLIVFSSSSPDPTYYNTKPDTYPQLLDNNVQISLYDLKRGKYVLRKKFDESGSLTGCTWSPNGDLLLIEYGSHRSISGVSSPFRVLTLDPRKGVLKFVLEMTDPNDYIQTFWDADGRSLVQIHSRGDGKVLVRTINQAKHTHSEMTAFKSSFTYSTWPKPPVDRIPISQAIDWKCLKGQHIPNGRVVLRLGDSKGNDRSYVVRVSDGQVLGSAATTSSEFRVNEWVVEFDPIGFRKLRNWRTGKTMSLPDVLNKKTGPAIR